MRKVAVIGAGGMLGYAVREYYASQGDEVLALGRAEFDIAEDPIPKLAGLLASTDVIINCAGVIKPRIAEMTPEAVVKVNAIFPRNLAKLARRIDARLFHVTTDCVYSGRKGDYTEDDYFDAEDLYGISKNAGDAADCMVLRTSIIGEEQGQQRSLLEWARSQAGKPVKGFLNHRWNGVTTVHLAELIDRILSRDLYREGLFHIHSPDVVDKYVLLGLINDTYGLSLEIDGVDAETACDRSLASRRELSGQIADKPIAQQLTEMRAFFAERAKLG